MIKEVISVIEKFWDLKAYEASVGTPIDDFYKPYGAATIDPPEYPIHDLQKQD